MSSLADEGWGEVRMTPLFAAAMLASMGAIGGRRSDEPGEFEMVPLQATRPVPRGREERQSGSIADKPHNHSREIAPEQFAAASRAIASRPKTNKSHRDMDALCMATLRSLGFGEGCDIFERFTEGYHG